MKYETRLIELAYFSDDGKKYVELFETHRKI